MFPHRGMIWNVPNLDQDERRVMLMERESRSWFRTVHRYYMHVTHSGQPLQLLSGLETYDQARRSAFVL